MLPNIAAESRPLPPFNTLEDVTWVNFNTDSNQKRHWSKSRYFTAALKTEVWHFRFRATTHCSGILYHLSKHVLSYRQCSFVIIHRKNQNQSLNAHTRQREVRLSHFCTQKNADKNQTADRKEGSKPSQSVLMALNLRFIVGNGNTKL